MPVDRSVCGGGFDGLKRGQVWWDGRGWMEVAGVFSVLYVTCALRSL